MKIGILTFHSAYNFGAVLQCYALFSTLTKLGHNVEVIDYRPDYLATQKETFHWYTFINRSPWKLTERVKDVLKAKSHYAKFEKFSNTNLYLSQSCNSQEELKEICNKYDCVVIGSDQVWCDKFNNNDCSWFGLDTQRKIKWVGYAVSAGKTKYDTNKLNDLIQRFHAIGARELDLYNTLVSCSQGNIDIAHVLDPTLLAPSDIWEKWHIPIIKEPYILTYQARESDDVFRLARSIAIQLGVKKIIPVDFYPNVKENGLETYVCSPDEFVALVKNARCVVTTSFHGTAFSVILGTPFYTLKLNDGSDGRAQNLLDSINLSDRMIDIGSDITFSEYNSVIVQKELNRQKEQSLKFLTTALQ